MDEYGLRRQIYHAEDGGLVAVERRNDHSGVSMFATESPAAKGRAAKGVRGGLQKLKAIRRYNGKDNSPKYRNNGFVTR